MKVKMDLLPQQYKCVRRDYLAYFILVISIIVIIILNLFTFLSMNIYSKAVEKSVVAGLKASENKVKDAKIRLESLKTKINHITFDSEGQLRLNDEIIAFNQIKRGYRWSVFFNEVEHAIPKRVWIKAIDISNAPHFTLICESADQILPITFEQNLILKPKYFNNVFLGNTVMDKKNLAVLFKISFDFNGESK